MAGGGDQRIVDAHDRERAQRPPFGAELLELGDLLFQGAARQHDAERAPPERDLLHAPVDRLLLGQAPGARILALLVAPDAVMRFAERRRQVHSGIGQREAFAAPQVIARMFPRGDAIDIHGLERNELQVIELAWCAEQETAPVRRTALRRVRSPGRVARRHVERRRVDRFVLLPARDRIGERELGEGLAHRRLERPAKRSGVERRRLGRLVCVHRATLDEQPLDGVKRRELVVLRLERAHLGHDPEQCGEEVLDVGGERDQELRLALAIERVRLASRGGEPIGQRRVRLVEVRDEQRVDARRTFATVEIGESETRGQRKRLGRER